MTAGRDVRWRAPPVQLDSTSPYVNSVLNIDSYAYWPLNESSAGGGVAASRVLGNAGDDRRLVQTDDSNETGA